jgi:hypothetical protein
MGKVSKRLRDRRLDRGLCGLQYERALAGMREELAVSIIFD